MHSALPNAPGNLKIHPARIVEMNDFSGFAHTGGNLRLYFDFLSSTLALQFFKIVGWGDLILGKAMP